MDSGSQPRIAIVILTYSQGDLLEDCLKSLKKFTNYKNYRIFVVDNQSESKIGERIKKNFKEVRVIINDKNYGFSKGNNIGINIAKKEYNPDYFLILNDDTEFFQKGWLQKTLKVFEKDRKTGLVGCKLVYPDKRLQNAGGFLKGSNITRIQKIGKRETLEVDHVMGAFMLVKREVMDKLNGFDEDYSPYLLEDTDYCLRAKKLGFKIKSFGGVEVIHKAHQSLKKSKDPKLFFRFKNDLIFSWRHLNFWNFLFRSFVYLPAVALFQKKDEDRIEWKNLYLRKDFIFSIFYLVKAYLFILGGRNNEKFR